MLISIYDKNGGIWELEKRANCWEYMRCGRGPEGNGVSESGICPAALAEELDGFNGGKNGGRLCWALVGTFCGGEIQGTFAEKANSCYRCNFFQNVKNEEGPGSFTMTPPGLLYQKKSD